MKRRILLIASSVLCLLFAMFVAAQIVDTDQPTPAAFLPEGALVYAETENLHDLLTWWRESDLKRNWQRSKNYESFSSSRLFLKGKDRAGKWGVASDFQLSLERMISLSGKESGLALYDIGNLKTILLTRISPAQAEAGELWAARGRFRQETLAADSYFIEPEDGRLCFAYKDPYLVVSTDEDLMRKTLSAMQDSSHSSILNQSDKWTNLQALNPVSGIISLYLDMEALRDNRYLKRYWIHRNVSDFRNLNAGWIALVAGKDRWTEHRYFLPEKVDASMEDGGVGIRNYVESFRDIRFETMLAEANPDAEEAARQILNFVNRFPESYRKTSFPPLFSGASDRAGQTIHTNRYMQQIDAPILESQSAQLWKADEEAQLATLLKRESLLASIRITYPSWDQQALFARFPVTLILQLSDTEKLHDSILHLIREHFLKLHSTVDLGAEWEQLPNGTFQLHAIHSLYVRFQSPWLIISNDTEELEQVVERLPEGLHVPSGFYAEIKWDTGRWKYSRIMRRLDHGTANAEQPLFFSQNINSLLQVLRPVRSSTVQRNGSVETVTYWLQ